MVTRSSAFSVVPDHLWNVLPLEACIVLTLLSFRYQAKTHIFNIEFELGGLLYQLLMISFCFIDSFYAASILMASVLILWCLIVSCLKQDFEQVVEKHSKLIGCK